MKNEGLKLKLLGAGCAFLVQLLYIYFNYNFVNAEQVVYLENQAASQTNLKTDNIIILQPLNYTLRIQSTFIP